MTDIKNQNSLSGHFAMRNIRHLFVDSNGTYHSAPINNQGPHSDPCIVSGVFFKELDRETTDQVDLNEYFKHVRTVSEQAGYSVLQGIKSQGCPLLTEELERIVKQ